MVFFRELGVFNRVFRGFSDDEDPDESADLDDEDGEDEDDDDDDGGEKSPENKIMNSKTPIVICRARTPCKSKNLL